jgi:CTD small phosphatase-like protein 2
MSEEFEIIVFTASHSCYANVVLNILDPENEFITFRLFRDHCLQTKEGIFIKDLRIIANRKLENIAIVDNATYSFGFQLDNGIPIVPFYDNNEDKELLSLM